MVDIFNAVGLVGFSLLLLVGLLLFMEFGFFIGRRQRPKDGVIRGIGPLETRVFSLFGLLLAFTFGGAATRWESRRQLIVQEATTISTAYVRLNLLNEPDRGLLRQQFRDYLKARLALYAVLPDAQAARKPMAAIATQQQRILQLALVSTATPENSNAQLLVIPAVNAMIDTATIRTASSIAHLPMIIFLLLFALALASAFISGLTMGLHDQRSVTQMVGYTLVMAISIWVILEVEFPRMGLIRLDTADEALYDVLSEMND